MSETLFLNSEQQVVQFKELSKLKTVAHCITTRNSFFMPDFNLSFHTGQKENVIKNRSELLHFFNGLSITIPKQCHGIKVLKITKDNSQTIPEEIDALITNVPDLVIGVLSADCVPILLYDPMEQALGIAHAGWRGTVGEIAAATLCQMAESYGSNPSYIKAYIGPSISCANFEVGDEVVSAFLKLDLSDCIIRKEGAKAHIDLWLANSLLLQRAGVPVHHITIAGMCTMDHTDQFYSARKEGFDTGRFGLFGMLKKEELK